MAAKASQVSSLVIGLGQVEEESRQLIWPATPAREWNCKIHNCMDVDGMGAPIKVGC